MLLLLPVNDVIFIHLTLVSPVTLVSSFEALCVLEQFGMGVIFVPLRSDKLLAA